MTAAPFLVLEVGPDAGDDDVKRRYLALVRQFSPERDPERFQEIRAAYEAIRDRRGRLRVRLLNSETGALIRLKRSLLEGAATGPGRASRETINRVLLEGLTNTIQSQPTSSGD